jgi:hypothetical protein
MTSYPIVIELMVMSDEALEKIKRMADVNILDGARDDTVTIDFGGARLSVAPAHAYPGQQIEDQKEFLPNAMRRQVVEAIADADLT